MFQTDVNRVALRLFFLPSMSLRFLNRNIPKRVFKDLATTIDFYSFQCRGLHVSTSSTIMLSLLVWLNPQVTDNYKSFSLSWLGKWFIQTEELPKSISQIFLTLSTCYNLLFITFTFSSF